MLNLYDVFQNERKRLKDEGVDILFSKRHGSMQYRTDAGVMTVLFEGQSNDEVERFLYRDAREKARVGLGAEFQVLSKNGTECITTDSVFAVPSSFLNISQDYRFCRDEIGINYNQEAEKTTHKRRNDFER